MKKAIACILSLWIALSLLASCGKTGGDAAPKETDYLVLVNKQHKLPDDWESTVELEDATNTIPAGVELNEDNDYLAADVFRVENKALHAFRELQAALAEQGVVILLDSTYRSVARQEELWSEFEEEYGPEYTQNTVAVPGTSEHHTGLAIDVCIVKNGVIINENADMIAEREIFSKIHAGLADYGFILRFPEDGKKFTGYDYEPWHFRYVGSPETAHKIMDKGLTLEEYLGAVPEAGTAGPAENTVIPGADNDPGVCTYTVQCCVKEAGGELTGVAGVVINFCTDTACTPVTTDENGAAVFTGPPAKYHVQIVRVPEGWKPAQEETEWDTGPSGENYRISFTRTGE